MRERLSGIILCVAVSLVMVIAVELVSRAKFGDKAPYSTRGMLRPSSAFPYPLHEWTPGARGRYRGLPLEITRSGFIGREIALERRAGVHRIAVIGDSIAAGWGLDSIADAFPQKLEDRLLANGTSVEVFNLGVPGYDAFESIIRLERVGLSHSPDVVVYLLCLNDILYAAGRPTPEATRAANYDARHLLWHSTWWRFVHLKRVAASGKYIPYPLIVRDNVIPLLADEILISLHAEIQELPNLGMFRDRGDGYTPDLGIGHFEAAIQELSSLSDDFQFQILVLVVPFLGTRPAPGEILASRITQHILEKYEIPHIDLRDSFRDLGFDRLRSVEWDRIHPNAIGHAEMSRIAASWIDQRLQPAW